MTEEAEKFKRALEAFLKAIPRGSHISITLRKKDDVSKNWIVLDISEGLVVEDFKLSHLETIDIK